MARQAGAGGFGGEVFALLVFAHGDELHFRGHDAAFGVSHLRRRDIGAGAARARGIRESQAGERIFALALAAELGSQGGQALDIAALVDPFFAQAGQAAANIDFGVGIGVGAGSVVNPKDGGFGIGVGIDAAVCAFAVFAVCGGGVFAVCGVGAFAVFGIGAFAVFGFSAFAVCGISGFTVFAVGAHERAGIVVVRGGGQRKRNGAHRHAQIGARAGRVDFARIGQRREREVVGAGVFAREVGFGGFFHCRIPAAQKARFLTNLMIHPRATGGDFDNNNFCAIMASKDERKNEVFLSVSAHEHKRREDVNDTQNQKSALGGTFRRVAFRAVGASRGFGIRGQSAHKPQRGIDRVRYQLRRD